MYLCPIVTGTQVIPGEGIINYSTGAFPRGYGVQAQQTVFDGYQTINRIRSAETQVMGAREQLRNTEQNTLLSGVTAYMDVLQDTAILDLDRNNVQVLAGAAARDPGPLYRRRSHPDRRRAGRGEPRQRAGDRAQRGSDAASGGRELPSGDRRPADEPRPGQADREAAAEDLARGGYDLAGRASGDHGDRWTASTRRSCRSRSPRERSTPKSA